MTLSEADFMLHHLKYYLADAGFPSTAGCVEDVQCLIWAQKLTSSLAKEYARRVLPPGRRGRIKLILHQPYEARGLALLYAILNSIEESK